VFAFIFVVKKNEIFHNSSSNNNINNINNKVIYNSNNCNNNINNNKLLFKHFNKISTILLLKSIKILNIPIHLNDMILL